MLKLVLKPSKFLFSPKRLSALIARLKHINHPGHKPKPLATKVKYDLPDNYVDEVIYPPVKPKYPPGEWMPEEDPTLAWLYYDECQKYHSLKTIQERLSVLAYMNVQQTLDDLKVRRTRYYPIYKLDANLKTPRMLPFIKYITKTNLLLAKQLPSTLKIASAMSTEQTELQAKKNEIQSSLDNLIDQDLYEKIKTAVIDTILLNASYKHELIAEPKPPMPKDAYKLEVLEKEQRIESAHEKSNMLIKDIMNVITSMLATQKSSEHLVNAYYDSNVNIMSYWKRCGFKEHSPRGAVWPDRDVIRFQFEDVASYQIKSDKPLKPVYIFCFFVLFLRNL
jgi:hypothetical protein